MNNTNLNINVNADMSNPLERFAKTISKYTDIPPALIKRLGKTTSLALGIVDQHIINKSKKVALESEIERALMTKSAYRLMNIQEGNIQNIVTNSVDFLEEISTSEENVEEDWLNNFFEGARNINNKEVQIIWSKLLAGEMNKPGSFSIRTLNVLKNLNKKEAEVFSKLSKLSIEGLDGIKYLIDNDNQIYDLAKINYEDILSCQDAGLIHSSQSTKTLTIDDKLRYDVMKYGEIEVKTLSQSSDTSKHQVFMNIYIFTQAGNQLSKLITHDNDLENLKKLLSLIIGAKDMNAAYRLTDKDNWIKF